MIRDKVLRQIDAIGMLLVNLQDDIKACGFVEQEKSGVCVSSMKFKQMTESELETAIYYLRNTRKFCQSITQSKAIAELQQDKAA